ncbi:unnamed protein product [Blepharisma stoltei]|uniref:Uncharacterized protein n=1 Tax=Blepharisma stoltei TaxID=1481888 RepID=A0AAU9IYJ3_9CILI|nr:unnamed protein product [Blepharisma stoltei]
MGLSIINKRFQYYQSYAESIVRNNALESKFIKKCICPFSWKFIKKILKNSTLVIILCTPTQRGHSLTKTPQNFYILPK